MEVKHPLEEGLKGIYGVIFSDEPKGEDATLRNVTIFADGQQVISPPVQELPQESQLLGKDALQKGEIFVHECITDGKFEGEVLSVTAVDTYEAVVPKLTGGLYYRISSVRCRPER